MSKFLDYKINVKSWYYVLFWFCLIALIVPFDSYATTNTNDAISQTLCNVIKLLTGPIGKGISTIAIVVLGIGLFLGKLSWAVAVATAIGIGLIFGAGNMVNWIGSGTGSSSTGAASIDLVC